MNIRIPKFLNRPIDAFQKWANVILYNGKRFDIRLIDVGMAIAFVAGNVWWWHQGGWRWALIGSGSFIVVMIWAWSQMKEDEA